MFELDLTDLCRAACARLEARMPVLSASQAMKATELAAAADMGDAQAQAEERAIRSSAARQAIQIARSLLRTEPGYWVARLAVDAHRRPLPSSHPSSRMVRRAFGIGAGAGPTIPIDPQPQPPPIDPHPHDASGRNFKNAAAYLAQAQADYTEAQNIASGGGSGVPGNPAAAAAAYEQAASLAYQSARSAYLAIRLAADRVAPGDPNVVPLLNQAKTYVTGTQAEIQIIQQAIAANAINLDYFDQLTLAGIEQAQAALDAVLPARKAARLPYYPPAVATAGGGHGGHGHGGHGHGHGHRGGGADWSGWRALPPQLLDTVDDEVPACCDACANGMRCMCVEPDAPPGWPGHSLEGVRAGGRG